MASLAERLADAVMKAIETEGRISRDDLVQACAGVLAGWSCVPVLTGDELDAAKEVARSRMRKALDDHRADAIAFDKWCEENIGRIQALPAYGATELHGRVRAIYEAEKAAQEKAVYPPSFLPRRSTDTR